MAETGSINEIGSKVKIRLNRVKDRLPDKLSEQLAKNPNGIILDYKMTDAQGVGLIVKLNDGSQSWFFSHEVENCIEETNCIAIDNIQKDEASIEPSKILSNLYRYTPNKDVQISYILNPLNFFNWFLYCIKDII
tara:strand:- start:195 stop:599 length:405 start_codon:yes stop_codon:yes gene_type:complete